MAAARSHHNRGACCIPRRRLACPPVGPPGRLAAAQIGLERSPGEVTAASVEEDRGVEQISKAISQMDHCLQAKTGQRPSPADCGRAFDGRIVPTGACPAAPQSFQFIPSGCATQKWRGVKNSKKAARPLRTRTSGRSASHAGRGETRLRAADCLGAAALYTSSASGKLPSCLFLSAFICGQYAVLVFALGRKKSTSGRR